MDNTKYIGDANETYCIVRTVRSVRYRSAGAMAAIGYDKTSSATNGMQPFKGNFRSYILIGII